MTYPLASAVMCIWSELLNVQVCPLVFFFLFFRARGFELLDITISICFTKMRIIIEWLILLLCGFAHAGNCGRDKPV